MNIQIHSLTRIKLKLHTTIIWCSRNQSKTDSSPFSDAKKSNKNFGYIAKSNKNLYIIIHSITWIKLKLHTNIIWYSRIQSKAVSSHISSAQNLPKNRDIYILTFPKIYTKSSQKLEYSKKVFPKIGI